MQILWRKVNQDTNDVKNLINQSTNELKDLINRSTQLIVNLVREPYMYRVPERPHVHLGSQCLQC